MSTAGIIPVVLLAYARPAHLARVLACLRENRVPLIHAFADGAKGPADAAAVREVRAMLRAVDWCDLRLVERDANLGLGRNVLAGRWTFHVVEDFDSGYHRAFADAERRVRDELTAGRRHVYEARLKERERTRGRRGHEALPQDVPADDADAPPAPPAV